MVEACWLPGRDDDPVPKYRLACDGVRVKFDGMSGLRMRVEGELPSGLVDGWVAGIKHSSKRRLRRSGVFKKSTIERSESSPQHGNEGDDEEV